MCQDCGGCCEWCERRGHAAVRRRRPGATGGHESRTGRSARKGSSAAQAVTSMQNGGRVFSTGRPSGVRGRCRTEGSLAGRVDTLGLCRTRGSIVLNGGARQHDRPIFTSEASGVLQGLWRQRVCARVGRALCLSRYERCPRRLRLGQSSAWAIFPNQPTLIASIPPQAQSGFAPAARLPTERPHAVLFFAAGPLCRACLAPPLFTSPSFLSSFPSCRALSSFTASIRSSVLLPCNRFNLLQTLAPAHLTHRACRATSKRNALHLPASTCATNIFFFHRIIRSTYRPHSYSRRHGPLVRLGCCAGSPRPALRSAQCQRRHPYLRA